METSTQYDDLKGQVSADIFEMAKLNGLARSFEIDLERYNVIGLDLFGVEEISIAFIAIDRQKSTAEREHLVKIEAGNLEDLGQVIERLHIILLDRFRQGYLERGIDETIEMDED